MLCQKPVAPCRTSSGSEPRGFAITGVPAASDSTTDSERLLEVDQVEQRGRAAERLVALGWPDGPDEAYGLAIDAWLDLLAEVGPVMHHARDQQGIPARQAASMARCVPLSGWIRPRNRR